MRVRHEEDLLSCQSLVQQFMGPGCRGDLLALPGRKGLTQQEHLFNQEDSII